MVPGFRLRPRIRDERVVRTRAVSGAGADVHGAADERTMRQRKSDRLVDAAFWTLAVICLLSLNEAVWMWIGVEHALSVPMLLCCLIALLGLLRFGIVDALGRLGVLLVVALASYVGIGILAAILTTSALHVDPWDYLERYLMSILLIVAAAVGGRVVFERAGREMVLLALLGILTIGCAFTIASPWLFLVFQNPPGDGMFRHFGTAGNPNEAGFIACLTVVLALSFVRTGRFTVLGYGSLFVATTALIGTYSRTSLLILAFVVVGGVVASRGRELWRFVGGLAVVGWLAGRTLARLAAGTLQDSQIRRLSSLVEVFQTASVDDLTMAGRLTLWRLATEQALESPAVGSGLGQLHSLEEAWISTSGTLLGAHNVYLTLWGEAGLIPVILFVLFLAGMLRLGMSRRLDTLTVSVVGGWGLALLLAGVTSHSILLSRSNNFVIGVACAAAAARYSRRSSSPAAQ